VTDLTIHGAGGGGGGSSKQRTPREDPNTLRSVSKGRILDLIAHGPIHGLVNGLQSIFLDDTPLQNPDGTFNFEGVTVHTRNGYPDQDYIPGFPAVENTISVSAEVTAANPIVRSTTNPEVDAVVVTVQLQGLSKTDAGNGDVKGTSVTIGIDVRSGNGDWTPAALNTIAGKTNSAYQKSIRVPLTGTAPFDIRVRRVTPDSESSRIVDKVAWTSMVEIVDTKLSYPDSALVGIELDASLFGSSMPSRSYDVKLSIIRVPSNYDPLTRTYTGLWDGQFKRAWTDNPAWAFYDLATDPVIGADVKNVDKWALYQIGRYCDELVPDGYGGMEPRFTINTVFAERRDAINVLADLASVFRGMCYWGSDSLVPVADMPADPVKLVTPANVVNGEFEYSGTSLRERHSVAIVMWNDPDDNYRQKPEFVEDPDSIELFGWRETQVTALGCTSRGQARRLGKWILYSERSETQTVNYTASMDHADLRPGDFIEIADPDQAGARMGGRVMVPGSKTLTLDKVPAQTSSDTWFLSVTMPTGQIERRQVLSFSGDEVTLQEPLSAVPLRGAVWVLTSLSVTLPIYRVTAVSEDSEKLEYKVTATEHDPTKYNRVERDLILPDTPVSFIPSGPVSPPSDLSVRPFKYLAGGADHQGMTISWSASRDVRVESYQVEVMGPGEMTYRTAYSGPALSFDELDTDPGEWLVRVRAVSSNRRSEWVNLTVNAAGLLLPAPPDSVDIKTATFSVAMTPRNLYPGQLYEFWRSDVALSTEQILDNASRVTLSTNMVDAGLRPDTTYFYYIRGANIYGHSDWFPAQAKTLRNFDDIVSAIDEDIRKEGGLFDQITGELGSEIDQAVAMATKASEDAQAAVDAAKSLVPRLTASENGLTDLALSDAQQSIQLAAVATNTEGFSALVATEKATRELEDGILGSRIDTVTATAGDNKAAIQENSLALVTAEQALLNRTAALESSFHTLDTNITSRMSVEETTRATETSALSQRMGHLEASVGENISSRVKTVETALATTAEALATKVTQLESSVGDQFASISQTYATQAYTDGAVSRAVTTVTVNGKKAVFGISVNKEVAEIGAIADRFYIYNPYAGDYTLAFAVEDGVTVIRDALIRDASITMAKIADSLQSDNYIPGAQGWRLSRSGVFEINGSSAGQGQLVQTNQTISVFDATGRLRVQLGRLT